MTTPREKIAPEQGYGSDNLADEGQNISPLDTHLKDTAQAEEQNKEEGRICRMD